MVAVAEAVAHSACSGSVAAWSNCWMECTTSSVVDAAMPDIAETVENRRLLDDSDFDMSSSMPVREGSICYENFAQHILDRPVCFRTSRSL